MKRARECRPPESGDGGPLKRRAIEASLRTSGLFGDRVKVDAIEDLSQGIAGSLVLSVAVSGHGRREPDSLILKIPDWSERSLVQRKDPLASQRERLFYESGLADLLPAGLRAPEALFVERRAGKTWIWIEDLASCLEVAWSKDTALTAARRCALLDSMFRDTGVRTSNLPWLGNEEHSAYAHHIPAAHHNLELAVRDEELRQLFRPWEVAALHRCLDLHDEASRELNNLRQTLVHGDFHISNLGFDQDGALVLLDWAHVGVAAMGSDVAIFVSVYRLFGGVPWKSERGWENDVLDAYLESAKELEDEGDVRRAFGLWHLTWGLHLRLGPGLGALLRRDIGDDAERRRTWLDVREGCDRALATFSTMTGSSGRA